MRPLALAALVSRLLHAVAERAGLPRFLDRQAPHVEETAEDQIGPRADEEGVPGALGLDQRYLREHRAGLLPLGTAEVEDTAREQHRHRQERQGSHRVSSISRASDGGAPARGILRLAPPVFESLENTRERLGRGAERSGDSPGAPTRSPCEKPQIYGSSAMARVTH